MSAFTLRSELVGLLGLEGYPPTHEELPDALAPPGWVVCWKASSPSAMAGMQDHRLDVECWPSTDLRADPHYSSRDAMVERVLELVSKWKPTGGALSGWEASPDERQLSTITTRIAVVSITISERTC